MHQSIQNITQCHYLENYTLTFVKNQLIHLFICHLLNSARNVIRYYQRAGNLIS